MLTVNLFDNNFYHTKDIVGTLTSTYYYPPTKIHYMDRLMEYDGITLFTDNFIFSSVVDEVKSKLKIAWLFEPRVFTNYYEDIIDIEDKFDYILTYDKHLLARSPKYIKYIVGQSRIPDDVAKLYPKTKEISMIASSKRISDGHIYRHDLASKFQKTYNFDLWGSGYKGFDHKLEPLKDYKYSICVMNSMADNFFTEVLLDCFRVGTIPIFWGCPNISEYFNTEGMYCFDNDESFIKIMDEITTKPKEISEKILLENFELSKQFIHTDDYIANILSKL